MEEYSKELHGKSLLNSLGTPEGTYTGEYYLEAGIYWYKVEDNNGNMFETEECPLILHKPLLDSIPPYERDDSKEDITFLIPPTMSGWHERDDKKIVYVCVDKAGGWYTKFVVDSWSKTWYIP